MSDPPTASLTTSSTVLNSSSVSLCATPIASTKSTGSISTSKGELFKMASSLTSPLLPANPKSGDYQYFIRLFENYIDIIEAKDATKLPLLLNCLGRDGLSIYDGLKEPKGSYNDAKDRLLEYFSGKTSILLRRKQFFEARQGANESITDFACRLRKTCEKLRIF